MEKVIKYLENEAEKLTKMADNQRKEAELYLTSAKDFEADVLEIRLAISIIRAAEKNTGIL